MKQEKKRIRSVWKYHFENVRICCETDVIYTRCRICKEYKPSNLKYFRKDSDPNAQRLIQPLCLECARQMEKAKRYKKDKGEREEKERRKGGEGVEKERRNGGGREEEERKKKGEMEKESD